MLTTYGKNWIANHFGKAVGAKQCYVSSGISYTDPKGVAQTGGTQDVVASMKLSDLTKGPGGETYSDLVKANGNNLLTDDDVTWIGDNDGSPFGESQYCTEAGTTPTGSDLEARVGTYDFSTPLCTPGQLSGTITVPADIANNMGWEKSVRLGKQWFNLNGVKIGNTSPCIANFAVEMRIWPGVQATCPTSGHAWADMNRNIEEDFIRIVPIGIGATEALYMDFFVPTTTTGVHTLCLYVWADFSAYDLKAELADIGYTSPETE